LKSLRPHDHLLQENKIRNQQVVFVCLQTILAFPSILVCSYLYHLTSTEAENSIEEGVHVTNIVEEAEFFFT
jgi:hypothetical protein